MSVKHLLLVLFVPLLLIPELANAQKKANPLIYNFEPEEYGAHNQTWEITQTRKGHIAVATGSGIVIFDGEEFDMVRGEPAMITDLITTSDGSTYYGANNILGQIVEDSDGFLHYHSLTDEIDADYREFGTVWNLLEYGNEILVPTRESLFRYSGEHFEVTTPIENTFFRAFDVDGSVFVSEIDTGLLRYKDNGELEPIPGGDELTGDFTPYFILPYDDTRLLIGTIRDGLFLFYTEQYNDVPEGTLEPFPNEINEQLAEGSAGKGIELINGYFAISTLTSGVFIINREGELIQKIDTNSGLQSDVVHDIYEDRQGNLWIAMNFGFALAEITSPVSYFDEQNGLEGAVIDAREVNGRLYAATSMGLYQKSGTEFTANEEISTFTWDLKTYSDPQNPEVRTLLAANDFGLYMVNGDETTRLSPNHSMSVFHSAVLPERIYAGTPLGLYYVDLSGDEATESDEFLRFENPVRQILEDEEGGLWIATQSDGLRYVLPDFDEENVKSYRDENGFNVLSNATLHWIEGELFVSTVDHFYQYDQITDTFTEWNSPGLERNELEGIYRFYHKDGTLWTGASSRRENITEYRNLFSESAEKITAPFLPIPSTVTLFIDEIFDDLWFGNAHGLYQYSPSEDTPGFEFPELQIRRIDVITDTSVTINPEANQISEHPYSNARFRFTVATPWFDTDRFMEYRYRLEGHDSQWSEWTENHIVEYTSLREGNYTFTVQSRNRQGTESSVTGYSFVINPPWYRSIWAYFFYGLFLIGLMVSSARLFNFYQTRKLENFNRKLEKQVQERSIEIRKQNEKLKQLNREKDEFMQIAVHDLRNPLSGIQGIAGLMSDEDMKISQEEVREFGTAIQKSTKRMFALIDNYLNVHRIEQGLVKANSEPVILNQLSENVIQRYQSRAEKKNMTLTLQTPDENISVMSDPALTSQVLDNLLSNAIKYSPKGSIVTLRVGKNNGRGFVSIADQGPGISKENQEKLYRKFSRIGTTPTGGEVSIGLGLSIVKQLLDMMNGEIKCESELGKGTEFTVYLPLA